MAYKDYFELTLRENVFLAKKKSWLKIYTIALS